MKKCTIWMTTRWCQVCQISVHPKSSHINVNKPCSGWYDKTIKQFQNCKCSNQIGQWPCQLETETVHNNCTIWLKQQLVLWSVYEIGLSFYCIIDFVDFSKSLVFSSVISSTHVSTLIVFNIISGKCVWWTWFNFFISNRIFTYKLAVICNRAFLSIV